MIKRAALDATEPSREALSGIQEAGWLPPADVHDAERRHRGVESGQRAAGAESSGTAAGAEREVLGNSGRIAASGPRDR
jgi:hypothetical protein